MNLELFMSKCKPEIIYLENGIYELHIIAISYFMRKVYIGKDIVVIQHMRSRRQTWFFYIYICVCACMRLIHCKVSKYEMKS